MSITKLLAKRLAFLQLRRHCVPSHRWQRRLIGHSSAIDAGEVDNGCAEKLQRAVCPLAIVPYDKQLQLKYIRNNVLLKRLGARLVEIEAGLGDHGTLDHMITLGDLCNLEATKPSPKIDGYRNKSEFSIGCGPDGNPKTVGYYVGDWKKKNVMCIPPTSCRNDKEEHIKIAQVYQDLIRNSPLPPMQDFRDGGHWRSITVRSNRRGQLMAIVTFHPHQLSRSEVDGIKQSVREHFADGDGSRVDSLYFQESTKTRTSNEESPFELLDGVPYLYETVCGLNFRISPSSFFQINTWASEVLYTAVQSLCRVDRSTTLIDVCCGTGTIGLVMAPLVKEVIGIEIVQQAVEDACLSASENGISNASFLCGAAEKLLPNLISNLNADANVVLVANPARSGLHPKVVRAIRNCPAVRRLVYISCKPDGPAFDNFLNLCKPADSKFTGTAFRPVRALPVDLFPHTLHCELVILFER